MRTQQKVLNDKSSLAMFRRSKNLTQFEFATSLKVSKSYLSKIESGFQDPGFAFLKKLKAVYPEVSIDEVFFTN